MDGDHDKAINECAASLSALLKDGPAKRRAAMHERRLRDDAVSSLRGLSDEALLATLHKLYRSGATHTGRQGATKTRKQADARIVPASRSRLQITLWMATAALAGAIVMGMEIVAFRLYAPYLGYSVYVWGTMISVVMAALSVGYALGGRLADRSRTDRPLYWVILAGAAYQFAIVLAVRSFLPVFSSLGDFVGTGLATLIIFAPPMAALAIVGPFVIRLVTRAGHAGSTAGRVYALSTMGSIGGILLTTFVLVPRLGTQSTLMAACAASAVLGVGGLIRGRRTIALVLLPLVVFPFVPKTAWGDTTVWVRESAYNLVRVAHEGTQMVLILNDERSVATRREETTGWTGGYYDDFALGPLLVPVRRALVLGMGAGGSIASTRVTAPDAEFDAVEIDPEVVDAAYRFFGLRSDDGKVRVHVADARPWIAADTSLYDFVHVDLYQGGPYVAFYLTTVEFFESVRRRMTDGGLMMMNVVDAGPSHELLASTVATLKRVFPSVVVFSRWSGNNMVLAFARERSVESVRASLAAVQRDDMIGRHARRVASVLVDFKPPADTLVFTDDRAPVEGMTRRMLRSSMESASGS